MAKKQGQVKAIPVKEVTEGMQVFDVVSGTIEKVLGKSHQSYQFIRITGDRGYSNIDNLKTLVVEYETELNNLVIHQFPLKYKQWQSAINNGEVDSDKIVEFEIVERYEEDTTKNYIPGKGQPAINLSYAKIIPQKKQDELLPILEALLAYGRIHTVEGVICPPYSHKEALDKLDRYIYDNYRIVESPTGRYRVKK